MIRVQINLYKGKLPPDTIYVGRGLGPRGRYGNPFKILRHGGSHTLEESLRLYRIWLADNLKDDPEFLKPLLEYKQIGCWCKETDPCHGDIILEKLYELYKV